MICLEGVSKSYRAGRSRKTLMANVSVTLPRGRSLAVLGRNGAGKSTLLRMIAGAIEPDEGVIHRHCSVSWPLGFTGGLHGALTGAQNARFVARIYGADTEDMMETVERFAGLGPHMQMPVSTYSSGMKARLAFALSMGVDFDVYLVDEVISVGDAAFRRRCSRALNTKLGRSDVIMVSHLTSIIKQYCDSAIVLEGGRVSYYDDIDAAIAAHERTMRADA